MFGMNPIHAAFEYRLVMPSAAMGSFAFYLALDLAKRLTSNPGPVRFTEPIVDAFASGRVIGNSPDKAMANGAMPGCITVSNGSEQGSEKDCFRRIFDSAPFGMCLIGLDMRFVQLNDALCAMLGYSAGNLRGTSWTKVLHPDDLGSLQNELQKLMREPGGYTDAIARFIHHNGTIVWVRLRISLVRNRNERPLHFVAHIEDITERRQAEEALRAREDRFRTIADSCPSMIWATDAEGVFQFINRAYRRFSGISCEDFDHSSWRLVTHPEDAPEYEAAYNRAIREHAPFSAEARVQRADGTWRVLGSRADPYISSSGEYLGHIGLSADITERIQAEQTRRFELSLMRSIHAGTLEGILAVDGEGIIATINKRFLDIWKIPDQDASGQKLDSSIGAADRQLLLSVLDRVESPEAFLGRIQELYDHPDEEDNCEVRLKDGRTIERHSTGLQDQEGKYLGRVWFFRDITTRKDAEISLQDAIKLADDANRGLLAERSVIENERKMLRALIDNIPDFMYVKDTESRFVVANSHLARVVGAEKPEKLVGCTDFDFYPPELASTCYEDDRCVVLSGQPIYNREEKGVDAAGNESYVLTTKVPIRDSNGQVIGIAGVGRDISARKIMENALREAEQKYRGIFDNAIIGIFQSTPQGHFLSVNHSMASTYGYDSPEEMIASITDISRQFYVVPKRSAEFMDSVERLGGVLNFECEAFRKDGSKIWSNMSVRAIHRNGVVIRYEGMCEDITERNLLRQQLLQAQKLESVGQLAAGIAHEINTPTQYIGDNVRFLKDGFLDLKSLLEKYECLLAAAQSGALCGEVIQEVALAVEHSDAGYLLEEIPKAIDQTLEGVTRVSEIVSAMKEFSHPGTKEKVPLDLNRAIDSTITVARNEWKYVADLETNFDPSLPAIPCLPGEFNQVILNLIVNAAHAIADVVRDGGQEKGKITVHTRNLPEWAEIRIQDTGSGIPENVQTRIFDPFFTTKEIGKGTGQGLAIARSVIVDKHGGTIHFETKEGTGTTFIIRLPHDGHSLTTKAVAA